MGLWAFKSLSEDKPNQESYQENDAHHCVQAHYVAIALESTCNVFHIEGKFQMKVGFFKSRVLGRSQGHRKRSIRSNLISKIAS